MISLIVTFIAVAVFGICFRRAWPREYHGSGEVWFCATMSGVILGMVFGLFTMPFTDGDYSYDVNLHAVNVDSQITGHFSFLGGGSINQVPVVYYYTKQGNSYTLEWNNASESNFIVTSGKPHAVVHCERNDPHWDYIFNSHCDQMTFYVPKGSIDNQFKVDTP